MNDDLDSMNDLDSILADRRSAPQEEAPAAPAAAEEPTPQPVVEPEAQEEKADGNTHLWRSRDLTAAARPVRKPMPMRAPVSAAPAPEKRNDAPRAGIITLLFGLLAALILLWALFNIHPASGTLSNASGSSILSLSDKLDVYVNNAASDALGELAYIKKIYTLQENDTVSPVPNPANFGTTNDPADIREVIKTPPTCSTDSPSSSMRTQTSSPANRSGTTLMTPYSSSHGRNTSTSAAAPALRSRSRTAHSCAQTCRGQLQLQRPALRLGYGKAGKCRRRQ